MVMKTLGDKIREYTIIGLLASTLVTAGWALKEIKANQALIKLNNDGVKALEEFQNLQNQRNVKEELVFDYVIKRMMGEN